MTISTPKRPLTSTASGATVGSRRHWSSPTGIGALIRGMDPWLMVAVIGLCAVSVVTMRGATAHDVPGQPYYFVERQLLYTTVGLGLMVVVAFFNYDRLRNFQRVIYGCLIGSILLVFVFATATRGSQRWIELPFFRFQPSELGKILLIIALASCISDRFRRVGPQGITKRVLLFGAIPALLVMAQPDLGTSLVYGVGVLALLFFAGAPWRNFAAIAAVTIACSGFVLFAGPAIGISILQPYQVSRLTSFLHPSENPSKEGWQQQQSKIAIGSGEKTGRGTENATQTRLNYLPEHHTDFIFGVVGETYGFAGASFVLSLYALLIWRGLRILTLSRNLFGSLIVGGLTVMLLYQIFINIGMTLGIMPITGVPAPLLSFGGSSMLVTLIAIGLMQSVHIRSRESTARIGRAQF